MGWVRVYDLRDETAHIRQVQQASLNKPGFGLDIDPALFGSQEWWSAIRDGQIPNRVIAGTVVEVQWGSMGDWPIWKFGASDGTVTEWTREGEHTRYVTGLAAQIHLVTVRWKTDAVLAPGAQREHEVLVSVDLEDSDERSARVGPGPFPGAYDLPTKRSRWMASIRHLLQRRT